MDAAYRSLYKILMAKLWNAAVLENAVQERNQWHGVFCMFCFGNCYTFLVCGGNSDVQQRKDGRKNLIKFFGNTWQYVQKMVSYN